MTVDELIAEEIRITEKFRAKVAALRAADPKMRKSDALVEAVAQLPRAYSGYLQVRSQLKTMRVPPRVWDF